MHDDHGIHVVAVLLVQRLHSLNVILTLDASLVQSLSDLHLKVRVIGFLHHVSEVTVVVFIVLRNLQRFANTWGRERALARDQAENLLRLIPAGPQVVLHGLRDVLKVSVQHLTEMTTNSLKRILNNGWVLRRLHEQTVLGALVSFYLNGRTKQASELRLLLEESLEHVIGSVHLTAQVKLHVLIGSDIDPLPIHVLIYVARAEKRPVLHGEGSSQGNLIYELHLNGLTEIGALPLKNLQLRPHQRSLGIIPPRRLSLVLERHRSVISIIRRVLVAILTQATVDFPRRIVYVNLPVRDRIITAEILTGL